MLMGLMDGAVNGMVSRIMQAGFSPEEAFCLAQVAYIKEHKREPGVPNAVLDRKVATWEINQTLSALGRYSMGPEAHRQRIILWEKVFGRGSWHEPIDPEEIYGAAPSQEVRQFKFVLPGQEGYRSDTYIAILSAAAESELHHQASQEGYRIDPESIEVAVMDTNDLRGAGHDMDALGLTDVTDLVAVVTGQGSK
jgi:hypothetical protein